MRVKAFVFDLDGTLLDTLADIADAMNAVLERHGLPIHSTQDYRRMVGWGARHLCQVSSAASDAKFVDDLTQDFARRYDGALVVHSAPYAGIPELLAELTARKIPCAVLSNKPHEATVAIVREVFSGVPFLAVRGAGESGHKPDPKAALEICATLGVEPHEAAMVGDTEIDMKTARNAGMVAVGVRWGFRPESVETADIVIDLPAGLLQLA